MRPSRVLITVVPLLDYPGGVPTEPIGRRLADRLLAVGERVRVLAEGEQAKDWPDGVEVVEGSITRPAEAPDAFAGITALFLAHPDPATAHEALRLARAGGATRVVNLSSHGPEIEIAYPPDTWHWLAVEVIVERSGMAWCHVVPPLVMGATLTGSYPLVGERWRDRILNGQPIRRAFAHAKMPFIHEGDLAAIIADALRRPDFSGQKVEVPGTPISDRERIPILRDVLRRDVRFEELSREQAARHYKEQGLADHDIAYALDTAEWYARHPQGPPAAAELLLGRPLRTYREWVEEHKGHFQ